MQYLLYLHKSNYHANNLNNNFALKNKERKKQEEAIVQTNRERDRERERDDLQTQNGANKLIRLATKKEETSLKLHVCMCIQPNVQHYI